MAYYPCQSVLAHASPSRAGPYKSLLSVLPVLSVLSVLTMLTVLSGLSVLRPC